MSNQASLKSTAGESEESSKSTLPADRANLRPDHLVSLTRLLIGGLEQGVDELLRQLEIWEQKVGAQDSKNPEETETNLQQNPYNYRQNKKKTERSLLRYAIIGWIFESQKRIGARVTSIGKMERSFANLLRPFLAPSYLKIFNSPFEKRFEALVARGQAEVERWKALGRIEDRHSRELAQTAFNETVDGFIEYLTKNPELQELIQTQSTGLANEVVEEVRERTVSADTFLEEVTRSLLRKSPRASLPEPPLVIRQRASSSRTIKGKGKT
jgi:hypothetical protein